MNHQPPEDANDPRWLLSALADGETDAAEAGRACSAWASADARSSQSWHAYHLIGDVLRSEDLAHPPSRDAAFLQRLSARLDREPAVLAPAPLLLAPKRRRGWVVPAALAAGVMALAAVLVVALGPSGNGGAGPTLAAAPASPSLVSTPTELAPAPTQLANAAPAGGRVLRDAQLDRYLQAHRDYATALPGSLPGGSGRNIATVSLER
jgi:sigma-E factor negative regulatory protein RseA